MVNTAIQVIKILLGLYLKSKYYFLDEPFQYLDQEKFGVLMDYISVASANASFVIIDHRNPELQKRADHIYVIREQGSALNIDRSENGI